MFIDEGKTTLTLDLAVENDLEVDNEGNFYIVTFIYPANEDEVCEARVSFEDVVENLIDFYRDDTSTGRGFGQLYGIANELERAIDRLREVAGYMEDRHYTPDLFEEDEG